MAEEEIRESVSKAKEENLGLSRAIPSNQIYVVDALCHFPRQPPSAPTIPSARRRTVVRGFKEIKGPSGGQFEFGNRGFVKGQHELLWMMHAFALDERMMAIEAKAKVNDGLQNLEI
ncbi:unnamed protein product [Cochlearia groenlandica]